LTAAKNESIAAEEARRIAEENKRNAPILSMGTKAAEAAIHLAKGGNFSLDKMALEAAQKLKANPSDMNQVALLQGLVDQIYGHMSAFDQVRKQETAKVAAELKAYTDRKFSQAESRAQNHQK
jgi:predicted glycoside hydrolase/deacetylase ChbG (UPF0249 family)